MKAKDYTINNISTNDDIYVLQQLSGTKKVSLNDIKIIINNDYSSTHTNIVNNIEDVMSLECLNLYKKITISGGNITSSAKLPLTTNLPDGDIVLGMFLTNRIYDVVIMVTKSTHVGIFKFKLTISLEKDVILFQDTNSTTTDVGFKYQDFFGSVTERSTFLILGSKYSSNANDNKYRLQINKAVVGTDTIYQLYFDVDDPSISDGDYDVNIRVETTFF